MTYCNLKNALVWRGPVNLQLNDKELKKDRKELSNKINLAKRISMGTWKKCYSQKRFTRHTVGINKLRNDRIFWCGTGNGKPRIPVKAKNLIVIYMN